MTPERLTLIDDGRAVEVPLTLTGDRIRLTAAALQQALGWELTEEGLCRDGLCVPRRARAASAEEGIELADLAETLDRPLALDLEERAAYLGVAAADRAGALASLIAPDFSLPDLDGRVHALSAYRGKKVLLVVYASW
jgi:hypothetical protein